MVRGSQRWHLDAGVVIPASFPIQRIDLSGVRCCFIMAPQIEWWLLLAPSGRSKAVRRRAKLMYFATLELG